MMNATSFSPDAIPAELKNLPQWVLWKREFRDGLPTKVPYCALTDRRASVTDPTTWCSLEDAVAAFQAGNGSYSGIGFVFTESDPYCGIDLDHVRDPATGEIQSWALAVIRELDSYTELSQSGEGVHAIVRARLPDKGHKKDQCEIYDRRRYFVVTGNHLPGTPGEIQARQDAAEAFYHEKCEKKAPSAPRVAVQRLGVMPLAPDVLALTDEELIAKAKAAKNGEKFCQLWEGRWKDAGYPSQSEADAALLGILCYWTDGDQERSFTLFEQSGLRRDKWFDREDYRERTWNSISKENTMNTTGSDSTSTTTFEWQEPISLDHVAPPPAFTPNTMIPEKLAWLRGYITAVANSLSVPEDLVALLVLGGTGLAAAGAYKLRVKPDYSECANDQIMSLPG